MNTQQKQKLRKQAHDLKPVVLLGSKGLTPAVLAEIEIALEHHELIKIKIPSADQEEFQTQVTEITAATHAEIIQSLGHSLTIYRKSKAKKKK